jgi:hypothetical protein
MVATIMSAYAISTTKHYSSNDGAQGEVSRPVSAAERSFNGILRRRVELVEIRRLFGRVDRDPST